MPHKKIDIHEAGQSTGEVIDSKKHSKITSIRHNRIFILDTNVLLHDFRSMFAFAGVVVGIPFVVLEELDQFKKATGELGVNARRVIRALDELRAVGRLSDGVEIKSGSQCSILKVFYPPSQEQAAVRLTTPDNLIIATVEHLVKEGNYVTFVTKDINARVKADALGLQVEDYISESVGVDRLYRGWIKIPLGAGDLKKLTPDKVLGLLTEVTLYVHQYIIVESQNNPWNYRLFRFLGGKSVKEIVPQKLLGEFQARNVQQLMALDLLLDDDIKVVSLVGPAGTGKTFLVLLAGLLKVLHEYKYRRFLVTRPIVPLGSDVGYLPGELEEKLRFWMQPIYDNLEFIFSEISWQKKETSEKVHRKHERRNTGDESHVFTQEIERLKQRGILSLEAITYMRGRSIPNQFMFIDEVQNLTPHQVKTIVSRAGEGTKVILAGDPFQIDSPFLDFSSNGLTVTVDKLKGQKIHGAVFLETTERSEVAQLAAEIL